MSIVNLYSDNEERSRPHLSETCFAQFTIDAIEENIIYYWKLLDTKAGHECLHVGLDTHKKCILNMRSSAYGSRMLAGCSSACIKLHENQAGILCLNRIRLHRVGGLTQKRSRLTKLRPITEAVDTGADASTCDKHPMKVDAHHVHAYPVSYMTTKHEENMNEQKDR